MKVLIGKKVGMTQIFNENGAAIPVTILDVSNNVISKQLKTGEKVSHIEIGKDKRKITTKADQGNYKELGFVPRFKRVFKVLDEEKQLIASVSTELKADIFQVGDKVQITSETKGKGFASVIKRWKFAGGPRTHGASDRERAPGSIGSRTIPGRVFKGKKMGGHMGTRTKTILGLKVAQVYPEDGLIAVSGAIPGANKCYVVIKSK